MRKIFWRFYLTVAIFFLVSALAIGGLYKHILTQNSQYYLTDIFRTTLYLIEHELIDVPQNSWSKEIKRIQNKVPVQVEVNTWRVYTLTSTEQRTLFEGNIVMLKEKGLFLQQIPGSEYILALGPIHYLQSLSKLHCIEYLLLFALCLSLAIPAFFWLRPLWRQLQQLSRVATSLGAGHFATRIHLPASSPLHTLANTFNSMAHNIQQLMEERKLMIDAVSHDLRTPIARLRYRIEALRIQLPPANRDTLLTPMSKDLDYLGEMTDELLLFSSLDCPEVHMEKQCIDLIPWLTHLLQEFSCQGVPSPIENNTHELAPEIYADQYYLERAITNLLTNARRYGYQQMKVVVEKEIGFILIHVDDDGPGIPASARLNVLQPFIRLDPSRSIHTGGYGMGLAIVQKILHWHNGKVIISESIWGGARITLCWPNVECR